jgi:hypothetical protein
MSLGFLLMFQFVVMSVWSVSMRAINVVVELRLLIRCSKPP